jgi:histidine triad (HIT) family protein
MDCLFCKIANKEIPSNIIFENEHLLAFTDIYPKAPTHVLIIPRKHIATVNDLSPEDTPVVGELVQTAKHLAAQLGIADNGYRLVFNVNEQGGQQVYHIHLHLLGGRTLHWPPG